MKRKCSVCGDIYDIAGEPGVGTTALEGSFGAANEDGRPHGLGATTGFCLSACGKHACYERLKDIYNDLVMTFVKHAEYANPGFRVRDSRPQCVRLAEELEGKV